MVRLMSIVVFTLALLACTDKYENDPRSTGINPSFLQAEGQKADRNYSLTLPNDHQSHPNFDIEWWYLTANLVDEALNPYAFQWTLFRFNNPNQDNRWHAKQTFMAHTSLHTPTQHWFEERFAAGGVGNASVGFAIQQKSLSTAIDKQTMFLSLKMDDWLWQAKHPDGTLFPATLHASVSRAEAVESSKAEQKINIEFQLNPSGPFVLQGDRGYSVKSREGKHASHYYSLPFIDIHGTVTNGGTSLKLSGKAWYDHEWTSTLLDASTAGWDWMSLHFDNGDKLMAFSMRLNDQVNFQTGTYIYADGQSQTLQPEDIALNINRYTEVDGRSLPLNWQVSIPNKFVDIKVIASKQNAFNPSVFGYYEGAVVITGTHTGVGFLELTGY